MSNVFPGPEIQVPVFLNGDWSDAAVRVLPTWEEIRFERNELLSASDWTQMPDNALDAPTIAAWAAYRQTLRNVPQDFDTPDSVVWPEVP